MDLRRPKVNILGVNVADISREQAVETIINMAKSGKKGQVVVTVNPEFVMLARIRADFAEILNRAELAVADGVGVVWAKRIFGGKFQKRITGVDLVENLCAKAAKRAITVGFLGGFGDVAANVAKRQKSEYPGLKVVLAEPRRSAIGQDLRLKKRLDTIGRVDILFVAFGMGRQEFWIWRHKKLLPVGVFVGVGGAFDMIAGVKTRAPRFMQWGLEWLWRLVIEPWRIWRMRVLPLFAGLVLWGWFWQKLITFGKKDNYS